MRQLKITKSITDRKSESLERYLSDVSREELISSDDEVELAQKIRKGDKIALEKLVRANLRFVISVAKQYQNQGMPLPDLICEGNIGLMKAAYKFDETRGFKFISYAVWWIRRSIIESIMEHSRTIRLPQSKIDFLGKVNRAIVELEQQLDREPTPEEIAEYMEQPEGNVEKILQDARLNISLDAPIGGDDNEMSLYDRIASEDDPKTDDGLIRDSLRYDIDTVLNSLTEREKEVIKSYYGIKGNYFCLEEIADSYDISSERVRQIKERALLRLRHSNRSAILKKYLA
jgi:RNA polymerase primary sigma factor